MSLKQGLNHFPIHLKSEITYLSFLSKCILTNDPKWLLGIGKTNITIIFITHDIGEALYLGKHVIVMDEGKVVGIGNHEELIKNCTQYQEIYYSQKDREEEVQA